MSLNWKRVLIERYWKKKDDFFHVFMFLFSIFSLLFLFAVLISLILGG